MALGSLIFPRLRYRLRYGQWCNHEDKPWSSQFLFMDGPTSGINKGWTEWEMYDLGRAKHRWCLRCGHYETTNLTPVKDWFERRGLVK